MTYERIELVKKILDEKGSVSFKELSEQFPEVSIMTLRRDIERLEFEGYAMKIRGGAKRIDLSEQREAAYSQRVKQNPLVKAMLAREALKFIETGRSVFLDSGTTIMELAKILPDIHLSIVTSGPNIALEIIKKQKPTVNLIGGTVNADNCSVAGAGALLCLKNMNIDLAFTSPSGFSQSGGFTVGNYAECEVKRAVIKKANKVIMLMSKDKLNKSLPFTFALLRDIDIIITDAAADRDFFKAALKAGVKIIKV